MTTMNTRQYNISYAPPVQVKDEPHRVLDTFDSIEENIEIVPDDYGSVSTIGSPFEIRSSELSALDGVVAV